jgi:hypothetical protein
MIEDRIQSGMAVRSRDGHPVGVVAWVSDDELVVAAGELFRRDQTVRMDDVLEVRAGVVILDHDRETLADVNAQPAALLPPRRHRTTVPPEGASVSGPSVRSGHHELHGLLGTVSARAHPHTPEMQNEPEPLELQPTDLQQVRVDEGEFQRFTEPAPPEEVAADHRFEGALHLSPRDLGRMRMESSKFLRLHPRHGLPEEEPKPEEGSTRSDQRAGPEEPGAPRRDPEH